MGGSSSWAGCRGCKVQGPGCHAKQPSLLSLAFTGPRPTTARHTAYAAAHQNNPVPLLCVCLVTQTNLPSSSPQPTRVLGVVVQHGPLRQHQLVQQGAALAVHQRHARQLKPRGSDHLAGEQGPVTGP